MSAQKKVSFGWAAREFILPRRKIIFIGLILILIRSAAGMVAPYASKILLDEIIPDQNFEYLTTLLFLVAGAIFVQALSSFSLTRLLSVEAQLLISELRAKVQRKLFEIAHQLF